MSEYFTEEERINEEARAAAKRARDKQLDDIRGVACTSWGRNFLLRVLEMGGFFKLSYVSGNALATTFNEGQRYIALTLISDIEDADPKLMGALMEERAREKQKESEQHG